MQIAQSSPNNTAKCRGEIYEAPCAEYHRSDRDLILQQAVLRAYDEVRRPRAQRVWEGSVYAGSIFEGYGKSQPFPEGLREDLPGLWDFIWYHGLEDDLHAAEQILEDAGVFTRSEGFLPQS